jgi:uncharacterized coiled-coil protein SlyX
MVVVEYAEYFCVDMAMLGVLVMGKFLRVLTVFNLILAAGALAFGIMLFGKREIVLGRNKTLEDFSRKVARTIEAQPAEADEVAPERTEMDMADVFDPTGEPEPDDFWSRYKDELESMEQTPSSLEDATSLRHLRNHFRRNPVDNKIEKNPLTGAKINKGEGTTEGVLSDLLDKATVQFQVLTATRTQLVATRDYLQKVIDSQNKVKVTARERQGTINELNNQINQLNTTIQDLRGQIALLKDEVTSLEGQMADLQAEKRRVEEDRDNLKLKFDASQAKNKELQARVTFLNTQIAPKTGPTTPGVQTGGVITEPPSLSGSFEAVPSAPGTKGRIVAVNEELDFVLIKLDKEFINELMTMMQTFQGNMLPHLDLLVIRDGEFVTKIKISDIDRSGSEALVVADILTKWQQLPIQVGDEVVYKK